MASLGRAPITRWPGGFNNVAENNILADMGLPDPTRFITHFEDFINYTAADWTVTAVGTGTSALTDVNGGVLLTTTSAASGDSRYSQKIGRGFLMATNKRTFFKARVAIDNVLTSTMILGIQNNTTTPKPGASSTDGIFFFKNSANQIDIHARKDNSTGATSVTNIASMVNNTYIELGWYYDADGVLHYSVDGVERGVVNIANFFPDAQLSMSFGFETNTTAARSGSIDYIFVAQER